MLSNLFSFFQLAWFCLKLSIDLIAFLFVFAIKKANQKKLTEGLLIILIIFIWILNLFIISQRNTVLINLEKVTAIENMDQDYGGKQNIINKNLLETKLEDYKKIENMKIDSLGLYLNLAELNLALKNTDLSREYLNKAQQIDPKIKYLEI